MNNVCIFAASSPKLDASYIEAGYALGEALAENGIGLVFGGGRTGLMGACARGVRAKGGRIIGVIPEKLHVPGIAFEHCDELIVTKDMHERKATMERLSDGYIALPGGIGTFEEFFEILTLKQLCRHNKPIAIYNVKNYYSELNTLMETAIEKNFVHANCRTLYTVTDDMQKLLEYIEAPVSNDFTVNELKEG